MIGFLSGATAAAALAAITWIALNAFTVTQVERTQSKSTHLEDVSGNYPFEATHGDDSD